MNMVVTHCPDCKKKLKALDSRPHFSYGFPTVKRRRCCMHCTFRTTTIEGDEPFRLGRASPTLFDIELTGQC